MGNFRILNLMIVAAALFNLGCGKMSAWKLGAKSIGGAWPAGPASVPTDPGNLDSGIITPFSQLNPDREVWVASYGADTDAGTMFEPKRTIGAALSIAAPGTAIMVKAGVYRENLLLDGLAGVSGKPIWLRSADGKGRAEIAAPDPATEAVRMIAVSAVIFEGFRINGGVLIDANPVKSPMNVVLQNNIVTNGVADGIRAKFALNIFLIGNDVSASPRGNGISILASHNVLIADNYIHDLRTLSAGNDGLKLQGDVQDVLIQNNMIERVDGIALSLEGLNVTARANSLQGTRRSVNYAGCSNCDLERNNILLSSGAANDVALMLGDSFNPTKDIKIAGNCVYRPEWLFVESGAGAGLVNQNNTSFACQ